MLPLTTASPVNAYAALDQLGVPPQAAALLSLHAVPLTTTADSATLSNQVLPGALLLTLATLFQLHAPTITTALLVSASAPLAILGVLPSSLAFVFPIVVPPTTTAETA